MVLIVFLANLWKEIRMEVKKIPVDQINVSKKQPRQRINEEKLLNLAESIQEVGQLQPVIVKRDGTDYLLIAGERRLRAIERNMEEEIAAVILDENIDGPTLRQIQLIENIQRQDLDALERAQSIQRYIDENEYNKKEASQKLGIPRTTLTEWLNILEVEKRYRLEVIDEDSPLSLSHITLAKGLVSRTGDPTKMNNLLDGVLKYKFSRSETKEIVEIIYKYLHIPMEEVFRAVLLKREHYKILKNNEEGDGKGSNDPVKKLLNSFTNLSNNLEEIMEKIGLLEKKEQQHLIDEFLYIYQMLEIMIPELRSRDLDSMIKEVHNKIK